MIDDELRAAQRAFEERGDAASREAYAAVLRRLGRTAEVIDVLHAELPRHVRALALEIATKHAGRMLIVGKGQWGDRAGVVDVEARSLLYDGSLTESLLPGLRAAASEGATVWPGELDFMAKTDWKLAWTEAPAPFHLVARERDGCKVESAACLLGSRSIPRPEIVSVHAFLEQGWLERGVALRLRSGEELDVARDRDEFVAIDPTYDGINLMCDTSWVLSLGRSLAAALGVPFTRHEDLS
jgi:hypothetical protein